MTAREYLEQYRQAQRKADSLREEYEETREKIGNVHAPAFSEYHHAGISKPTETLAEEVMAAGEIWKAAQLDALEIRQSVFWLIMALSGSENDVLYERYVNLRTWEAIKAATGYSHRAAYKIHRQALSAVQELLDEGAADLIKADFDAFKAKYIDTWHHMRQE